MKKLFFILLAILLFAGTAFAGGLELQVVCSNSVTINSPLYATVNLKNWDCTSSVTFSRIMKAIVGNSAAQSLGGMAIYGPWNQATAVKTVPAATGCGTGTVTPGTTTPLTPTIVNAMPVALQGTMAMVYIEALTSTGESLGGGSCMVNVQ